MVSFTLSALTLGLVALSSARPGKRNAPAITEYAFTLQAEGYPALTLNAVNSAHFNGTKLQFDLNDPNLPAPYGMSFHDVGDNYGITVPVTAIFDGGKDGFSLAGDGTLGAPMDAAFNHFFACNGTVNGEEILQLKWGVFESNGENPAGCVA